MKLEIMFKSGKKSNFYPNRIVMEGNELVVHDSMGMQYFYLSAIDWFNLK